MLHSSAVLYSHFLPVDGSSRPQYPSLLIFEGSFSFGRFLNQALQKVSLRYQISWPSRITHFSYSGRRRFACCLVFLWHIWHFWGARSFFRPLALGILEKPREKLPMGHLPSQPDRANRRLTVDLRARGGELATRRFTAAVAHPERSAASGTSGFSPCSLQLRGYFSPLRHRGHREF